MNWYPRRCPHSCPRRRHKCLLDGRHKKDCVFVCGMNLVNSRTKCSEMDNHPKIVRDGKGQIIRVGVASLPSEEDLKAATKALEPLKSLIEQLNAPFSGE